MLLFKDTVSLTRAARRNAKSPGIKSSGRRSAHTAPSHPRCRNVALLISTAVAYASGLIKGIARYNSQSGWIISVHAPDARNANASLDNWTGDGIVALSADPRVVEIAAARAVPLVVCDCYAPTATSLPCIVPDDGGIARLALQHLRERALSHFACVGAASGLSRALEQRAQAFCSLVARGDRACHSLVVHGPNDLKLIEWLTALPKPVGIFACDDDHGLRVLNACRRAQLAVPDDVAVIGVGNDEPMCELSTPPLSSIDINAEGAGHEAAALLDRMMNDQPPPDCPMLISPRGVVSRRSTDVLACDDAEVSRALAHICQTACRGLQVVDVLAFMGMSRATLQQRMKQAAGRTIHQEIQRVRLARVKELLVSGDLTIKQVARESGFASVQYMTRVFRATTGETPAKYRERRAK